MNELANSTPAGQTAFGPRSFGEILDRTFHLLRTHMRLLAGISAVPFGAMLALYVIVAATVLLTGVLLHIPNGPNPEPVFGIAFPLILVACIPIMAVFALYLAAASYVSTQADAGIKVTFREAYRLAWRRAGRHFLLLAWVYLRAFGPALAIMLLMFSAVGLHSFLGGASSNPATFLFFPVGILLYLAAFVYGIVVALRLSLAFPACVVEGLTARSAIQRSSYLTQGAKGRIFLMLLVIYAISYVFLMAFYLVALVLVAVGALGVSVLHLQASVPWSYIGLGLGGICVAAVIFLWTAFSWSGMTTALAVLYNDQRVRREGYDIERMMQRAGMTSAPAAEAPQAGESV